MAVSRTLLVRKFMTRGVYADISAFRRVIANEFWQHVGPGMKGLLKADVANWKKKPKFNLRMEITRRATTVEVLVEGNAADVWSWLDQGVPERVIIPRRHRQPRQHHRAIGRKRRPTRAALKFPGRSGQMIFRNRVVAGAIAARKYAENVITVSKPTFQRRMENAMRRAVRAAQKMM